MERTPAYLAALASVAVPGLDPVSVEALPSLPQHLYDVGFVTDTEHRRWVVRAPRTEAAAARMEQGFALLALLARRLPFAVPAAKGFAQMKECGRAVVYPYLPGHNLELAGLPPGPGLSAELGRAVAAVHNIDPRIFEEAGVEIYDADGYRRRCLSQLDRAAVTGRVPTALLDRWERALEDVALWRFATTPVHGDLGGEEILAVFDGDDAATGRIRALTGWDDAKVADPAADFTILLEEAPAPAVETVLEAYAHARVDRPDPNLLVRARLHTELRQLGVLMAALARGDDAAVDVLSTQLHRLDDAIHSESDDDYRRTSLSPVTPRQRSTPPPSVEEEGEDDDVVAPGDDGRPSLGAPDEERVRIDRTSPTIVLTRHDGSEADAAAELPDADARSTDQPSTAAPDPDRHAPSDGGHGGDSTAGEHEDEDGEDPQPSSRPGP